MSVEHPEVEQTWRLEKWLKTYAPYPCFATDVARIRLELEKRGEIALTKDVRAELERLVDDDALNRANAFFRNQI